MTYFNRCSCYVILIRVLFAEAESEQKKMGINSALHIIIFDELDAICRTRGSLSGSTGVHDTVVNQLLAKVSGSLGRDQR